MAAVRMAVMEIGAQDVITGNIQRKTGAKFLKQTI